MDKAIDDQCTFAAILFHRSCHWTAEPMSIRLPKVQLSLRYLRIWFICSKSSFLVRICRTFSTRLANSSILASCSTVSLAGGSGSGAIIFGFLVSLAFLGGRPTLPLLIFLGIFKLNIEVCSKTHHCSSYFSFSSPVLTPLPTFTSLATQKPSMLCTCGYILRVFLRSTWYRLSTNLISPSSPTSTSVSTILMCLFFSAQLTTSSFSRGETEQVEQTMVPPTLAQSMAARISCFWMWEFLQMSRSSLFALIEWSLEMMPKPVQGASSSTLSKDPGKMRGYLRPSRQVTTVFVMPSLQRLNFKALRRSSFKSLAKMQPVFFIICAIQVVFPPGAEAMSSTLSPTCGSRAKTGRKEDALCNIQCPARYSGVAPMGTFDSQILIPTLLHSARGSKLAPRCIRLCANYFLLVLRVLVRMVSGLWVSLAQKNCTNSAGLRKLRKWSMSSKLYPQYLWTSPLSCSMQYLRGFPSPSLPMFMRMLMVSWICRLTTLMSTGSLSFYCCSRGGASQSTYSSSPYSFIPFYPYYSSCYWSSSWSSSWKSSPSMSPGNSSQSSSFYYSPSSSYPSTSKSSSISYSYPSSKTGSSSSDYSGVTSFLCFLNLFLLDFPPFTCTSSYSSSKGRAAKGSSAPSVSLMI